MKAFQGFMFHEGLAKFCTLSFISSLRDKREVDCDPFIHTIDMIRPQHSAAFYSSFILARIR